MNNTTQPTLKKWTTLAIALLLVAASLSCQLFSTTASKTTQPAAPAGSASAVPGQPEKDPTAVQGANQSKNAPGTFNVIPLDAGLDQYPSYHQSYSETLQGTYKGAPFNYTETVERDVFRGDTASLITANSPGTTPVYLYAARLGGAYYTQQKEGSPCRASQDKVPEDANPVLKLLMVKGAEKAGDDSPDGQGTAVHLRFDERSLPPVSGKAQGEAWVAENGALLKYTLTIQTPPGTGGDFAGTLTLTYSLSQIAEGKPITLPAPCQRILTDIPALADAADLIRRPGFMRYTSKSTVEQARQFYLEQLDGWTALPGAQPRPGDPPLPDTWVLAFAQPNLDGTGRLLIIQLTAKDGALTVIAQSVTTRAPVEVDAATGEVTLPGGDSGSSRPPANDLPTLALPDLPEYPGAQVIAQEPQAVMFMTSDSMEKAAEFYKSALEAAGWTVGKTNSSQGMLTQEWSKDSEKLMLAITEQAGKRQVILTAIP